MATVEITESLLHQIEKKFKAESHKIIDLLYTVEENPNKGKVLGNVASLLIKEIRYKSFRFYFIVDGQKIKAFEEGELVDVLLRFVRMSDKKHQQTTIDEIRRILQTIGPKGL